ncbi:hypothetical protein AB6A40_009319 [Gnathostoma spinigerum]|uniref:Autophagy-related protein 11 C-terminal domain-containing protein n=1 Tax=Gnathostoma spinigerum TaxID=75299 RepID=A0ABD6ERM2_9BILA
MSEECQAVTARTKELQVQVEELQTRNKDVVKGLTIEYELYYEKISAVFNEQLKMKDKEIESLKTSLAREREVHGVKEEKQDANPRKHEELRLEYEKEFKNKMQLLMKGMEEKKADEIAWARKEAEFNSRERIKTYEQRIAQLEQQLKKFESAAKTTNRIPNPNSEGMALETLPSSPDVIATQVQKSAMVPSSSEIIPSSTEQSERTENRDAKNAEKNIHDEDDDDDDVGTVVISGQRSEATQTRLRIKEMRMLITIQDIQEGCTVLVVWRDNHNSYIVFSMSPILYFVKQSSLRKMDIDTDSKTGERRPNCFLAVTSHLELCQIRKENNRYNLAVGDRFYRVEVNTLPIESSNIRLRRPNPANI